MGHSRAQSPFQGSSPSLLWKPAGMLQRYSSVNVQRFAARHIECRRYDTTVLRLHNCLREAPSRPLLQPVSAAPVSATGVAKSNTDQGHWFTQEVDAKNASYGRGHHRPRLVDGGILAVSSATLATGGDSGLGRSASPRGKREVGHPVRWGGACLGVPERYHIRFSCVEWCLSRSPECG
jgi:hypothetical protein